MTETVVSTNTDSVIAVSATTNTVSVVEIEPVLISTESGNVITVGTESSVLVEQPSTQILVTGLVGPSGVAGISEEDNVYSKRVDFVTDNLLYKGEAVVGASEAASVWRIRKIVIGTDGDVTETWASGTALFDKAWSDRLLLTYT